MGSVGAEWPQQPTGSQTRSSPQALHTLDSAMGTVFNSSCGGTSSCCLWAKEGKSEDVSWYPFNFHAFTLPPFLSLQSYLDWGDSSGGKAGKTLGH